MPPKTPDDDKTDTGTAVHVRSDLAQPGRPGGHLGVHQPIRPEAPVPPPEEPPGDEELARRIAEALRADGRLPDAGLAVSVAAGIAQLDGQVELEFHRTLATALARSVPGVLNVNNLLDVRSG